MKTRFAATITEIQSLGVRIQEHTLKRTGGAGPSESGSLIIGGLAVNVPLASPYVAYSPYCIKRLEEELYLFKNNERIFPVETMKPPRYYNHHTTDGIPCHELALLHGTDCLATSVLQTCAYWDSESRCRFCGIALTLARGNTVLQKTPGQLAETAQKAKALDGVRHMVLTTGIATPPGKEFSILARCAEAIKHQTDLSIHAQVMPPRQTEKLQELKDAGVDTVGIHIESFDAEVLKKTAPVKATLGLGRYLETWQKAVRIFGHNQVSSFILVGLGEKPDTVVSGSEMLADMGVYPFVVPLRPIPGSRMEKALPPKPQIMKPIYRQVARILAGKGLSSTRSLAGCVRCGACSALPAYERSFQSLVCHPAETEEEHMMAFRIRETVFVHEQKIFKVTDLDENDAKSIHLVVKHQGNIIGTVRVYPAGTGNGDWIGGRLAVQKEFRASGAGELLVREAVETVKKQGCNHFTANIQKKNVSFFKQLGWKTIGTPEDHLGRPHQWMEAELEHPQNRSGAQNFENRPC